MELAPAIPSEEEEVKEEEVKEEEVKEEEVKEEDDKGKTKVAIPKYSRSE